MLYRKVDCPHCGNGITVNNEKKRIKCYWCRRIINVKFIGNGKRAKAEVEAVDFSNEQDGDIYGY